MEQKNADQTPKDNNTPNSSIRTEIIDLQNLAKNEDIKNSDIILSILEICTFNKNITMTVRITQKHFGTASSMKTY